MYVCALAWMQFSHKYNSSCRACHSNSPQLRCPWDLSRSHSFASYAHCTHCIKIICICVFTLKEWTKEIRAKWNWISNCIKCMCSWMATLWKNSPIAEVSWAQKWCFPRADTMLFPISDLAHLKLLAQFLAIWVVFLYEYSSFTLRTNKRITTKE